MSPERCTVLRSASATLRRHSSLAGEAPACRRSLNCGSDRHRSSSKAFSFRPVCAWCGGTPALQHLVELAPVRQLGERNPSPKPTVRRRLARINSLLQHLALAHRGRPVPPRRAFAGLSLRWWRGSAGGEPSGAQSTTRRAGASWIQRPFLADAVVASKVWRSPRSTRLSARSAPARSLGCTICQASCSSGTGDSHPADVAEHFLPVRRAGDAVGRGRQTPRSIARRYGAA